VGGLWGCGFCFWAFWGRWVLGWRFFLGGVGGFGVLFGWVWGPVSSVTKSSPPISIKRFRPSRLKVICFDRISLSRSPSSSSERRSFKFFRLYDLAWKLLTLFPVLKYFFRVEQRTLGTQCFFLVHFSIAGAIQPVRISGFRPQPSTLKTAFLPTLAPVRT